MAYFGPADQAKQYFVDMGYEPANRQTTADFLVAVTDPNGRTSAKSSSLSPPPGTAAEYAAHFRKSTLGQLNRVEVDSYRAEFVGKPERADGYRESVWAEQARNTRRRSPYMISIPMQARAVMVRRVQMLRGGMLATGLNLLLVFSFKCPSSMLSHFVFI